MPYIDFEKHELTDLNGNLFPFNETLQSCVFYFNKVINTKSSIIGHENWLENPTQIASKEFLKAVIVDFGEGWRVWGKYFSKLNQWDDVNRLLIEAQKIINQGDIAGAIDQLLKIKGLGPSYASKVTRFLSPDAVVLDSVLSRELDLKYKQDYGKFRLDCSKIATKLKCQPREIESAIFTWIQICRNGKKKKRWQLKPKDLQGEGFQIATKQHDPISGCSWSGRGLKPVSWATIYWGIIVRQNMCALA